MPEPLPPRLREVRALMDLGLTYKEIAAALYVNGATASNYMRLVRRALHLPTPPRFAYPQSSLPADAFPPVPQPTRIQHPPDSTPRTCGHRGPFTTLKIEVTPPGQMMHSMTRLYCADCADAYSLGLDAGTWLTHRNKEVYTHTLAGGEGTRKGQVEERRKEQIDRELGAE